MSMTARLAAVAGFSVLVFTTLVVPSLRAADEVRASWITRTSLTSPQAIDDAMATARRDGYNTAMVQVRARGDAYFLNGAEPRPATLSSQPAFDPLADALAKGHARGLAVYAWINV